MSLTAPLRNRLTTPLGRSGFVEPYSLAEIEGVAMFFPLQETTGDRLCVVTGTALDETGGTVTTAAGAYADEIAAVFDGTVTLQGVTPAAALAPVNGDFSLAFSIYLTSVGADGTLFAVGDDSPNEAYDMFFLAGGLSVWEPCTGFGSGVIGPTFSTSTWYHLVLTYRDSDRQIKVFRGIQQLGVGSAPADPYQTLGKIVFGANAAGNQRIQGRLCHWLKGDNNWDTRPHNRIHHFCRSDVRRFLIFIGDSITEASYLDPNEGYVELLAARIGTPYYGRITSTTQTGDPGAGEFAVVNHGVSSQGLEYHETQIASSTRYADALWDQETAFVMAGGNELDNDGDPRTAAQTLTNMQDLTTLLQAAGYYVVLCDIGPRTSYTAGQQTEVDTVNSTLATEFNVATSHARTFLPDVGVTRADALYRLSQLPDMTTAAANPRFPDGLHPDDAGHVLMEADIYASLAALGRV
jgi:lysophospholipase L1-like esterase